MPPPSPPGRSAGSRPGPSPVGSERDPVCACCGQRRDEVVRLFSHRDVAVCFRCLDWLDLQRDRRIEGRSGGWNALCVEPVFSVRDLARAAEHYVRLGFTVTRRDASSALATRDRDVRVRLVVTEWAGRAGHSTVHLAVPDADEVAAAWRLAGVEVVGPDEVDGTREGAHTDPDGNRILFGSALGASAD